jgi:hypothetical protein
MHRIDLPRAGGRGPASRVLAVGVVFALGLGASPARAADETFDADSEGEIVEEPGFFGTYFPWSPDAALPAPVDDAVVMIYLLNLLPFGGIWGPLVAIDKDGRPEMGGDMVVPWLVPNLTAGVGSVCVMTPLLFGGMFAGLFVGSAVMGITGCPAPCVCVPCGMAPGLLLSIPLVGLQLWTAPTAVINAWGRAYRSRDGALPEQARPAPQPAPDVTPAPAPEAAPVPAPAPGQPAPPAAPAPAQPPAGEWGPAETPVKPPPAPTAPDSTKKKPGQKKPADDKSTDDGEWVPY